MLIVDSAELEMSYFPGVFDLTDVNKAIENYFNCKEKKTDVFAKKCFRKCDMILHSLNSFLRS